jgi:hypothetical protein
MNISKSVFNNTAIVGKQPEKRSHKYPTNCKHHKLASLIKVDWEGNTLSCRTAMPRTIEVMFWIQISNSKG